MKKLLIIGCATLTVGFFMACGGDSSNSKAGDQASETTETTADVSEYDPHRGEGSFNDYQPEPFDQTKADQGKIIFDSKCQSCHKLTDERLVGPGWSGVTDRRTAPWLLNFVHNPDNMLDDDPELQKQIEICMVRMPNQNLSEDDAVNVYNFMLENDGKTK